MSSTARNEQVSGPAPDEDLTEALPADIPAPVLRQLAGEAAPSAADDGPVPAARPASLPLSPGQQRLWYLHEINPASIEYNMQLPLRLAGKLDAAALGRALNGVAGRHESLRTVIEPGTGRGAQVIRPPSDVQVATVDLSLAEDPGEALRRCLTQDAQRPFDLRNGPLLRAMLARLGPTEHVLVLSVHHIVSDGWSMGILMDELRTRYAAEVRGAAPDLPDLAVQYADYAIWQQEQTSAAALDAQLGYWRRQLTGLEPLDLPSDLPRPPVRTGVGEAWEFEIPQETTAGLRRIARDHSATLFMTLVAAVQVLLARYSGADDIAVATAVSGRTHVKLENLIGFFVNRIVLRAHVDQSLPFGDFLDAVRRTVLDAFANQEVPFQRIVEAVRAERDPSRPPLASVTVHLHGARQQRADAGGLLMEELTPPMVVNANDLSFDFREQDGQLTAMLGYTTDLFTADTARGMAEALTTLLAGIAGRPGQQLADLPILESEKAARLTENTAGAGPAPQTVTEMFAAQVALAPGGAAVACGEQVLSYAELDARAGRVAQLLVGRGVGPEDIVAVAVPRSAEMIVALLAVLKAGAAYLPLDLGQPDQRLEFMIEDSRPVLALTTRAAASRLTPWLPTVVLDGDPATGDEAGATAGRGRVASRPGQLAYVIYTSGSTGRPKAVLVSHVGVRQMVSAQARQLATGPGTRVLQFASLGFDAAFWEIGMSLLSGGTLVMPATQEPPTGEDLARLIADHRITHLTLPPTVLATLPPAAASTVTALTVAGEACPPGLVRDWAGGRRMVNAYGPTECTVCATMSDPLDADAGARGSVPIGRALAGAGVYLLDPRLRPVPVGVPGDLYISGNGLARGYLGRPGGTAERFVADPYGAPGTRMYRSGDVARWRPGGVLEFLGRADSQVKLRGFRIELGEVEAVLSDHPDVASAAADIRRSPSGGDQLAVYLTARGAAELTVARLRDYARQRLPEHMVPAVFTVLRELPLTSSGKVDRRALPDPVAGTGEDAGYIAPRTEAERILAETWSDLLGVERVGMNDNFFDLGGDSILGLEVVARARDKGLRVIPPHLLTRQTVAELAAEATLADPKAAEQPKDQPAAGGVALLPVHRWFFENLADSVRQFNQSVFVELTADPDYQALRAAARALLDQHDALRLRAEQVNGQWRESTASLDADIVSRVDLSGLVGDAREEQVRRAVAAAQRDFPLARGPLARILLIDAGDGLPARLFIAVHHLAMDGVSWRILLSDLQRAYEQAVAGQEIRLPQRTTTFREWARRFSGYVAEGGFDAELDYWTAAERDAATPLPVDGPGPNSAASRRVVSVRLPAARTTVLLHEVPDAYRTGVTEALLSALSRVLADWTGQDRVGIAVEGHGRADLFEDADLSRTVGWFTALFPLALTVPASRDCGAALKAVKEQRRAVPRDGVGYGALRYLSHGTPLGAHPYPAVSFNYLGRLDTGLTDRPGLLGRLRPSTTIGLAPEQRRPQLIEINGMVSPDGGLEFDWAYSANVHSQASIEALAQAFIAAVDEIIDHCAAPESGGYTPSDFPLAPLDQASVDRIADDGRPIEDIYPLTPAQAGMLFHSLAAADDDTYVGHFSAVIDGIADPDALAEAWQQTADNTSALRTAIFWRGVSEPVQVVYRHVEIPIAQHDLRGLAPTQRQAEEERYWEQCGREQLDLHRAPLIRLTVLRLSDTSVRLLWTAHHLILDGWSFAMLLPDIFARYTALTGSGTAAPVPPARRPFRDYVAWLAGQDHAAAEDYWRRAMAGFTAPATLPFDRPARAAHRGRSSREIETWLSPEHSRRVMEWARQARVTVNTLVQGAWAVLLSRYCGQRDICFGATDSGRPPQLAGADSIIGMFIATLPVRCAVPEDAEIVSWLRELQEAQGQARQYGYVSLAEIQSWSDVPGGANLFDSIVVFENYPHNHDAAARYGLSMRDYSGAEYTNFALTLTAYAADQLSLSIGYDPGRFDAVTVDQLSAHLVAVLDGMTSGRYARLSELPMISAAERRQLLARGNGVAAQDIRPQCVHEAFAAAVAASPRAVAVQDAAVSLTFTELETRANQVAHRLRAMGVRPGLLVGVYLPRGADAVVAMLGVLKAGGAFVPVDPDYPDYLVQEIVSDAAAQVLITEQSLLGRLSWDGDKVICLDRERAALDRLPVDPPGAQAGPDDLAYVVYTSGTTGRPKGVMVSHRNVHYLVNAWNARYGLAELRPRCLSVSSLGVDLFFGDFLLSAFFGGSLVICPPDAVTDALRLAQVLAETRPQILVTVPVLAKAITESPGAPEDALASLRLLIVGSEGWKTTDCLAVLSRLGPQTRVFNAYGATETTVDATVFEASADGLPESVFVPVGRPLSSARVYVLDRRWRPVPTGVEGEVYVGGDGAAQGYWKRPGLTAERFLADPFRPGSGARMYRTGDLGRWRTDGSLEFCGRADGQIKVRGFRVEPGWVESVLAQHPAVASAAVAAWPDRDGYTRLAGYVVPVPGTSVNPHEVRAFLAGRLPAYAVPAAIATLDHLPLSPSGKVDRHALPAPRAAAERGDPVKRPRTAAETAIAGIWAEILEIDPESIGIDDNFFDLGGDSILSIRVTARILAGLGVSLSVRQLFDTPTIADLARLVEAEETADLWTATIPAAARGGLLPMSFTQQRLWFLHNFDPESSEYNIALALRLSGRLDVAALRAAVSQLAARHEALRTTFDIHDGNGVQVIHPAAEVPLQCETVPDEAAADRYLRGLASQPFDLRTGPVLRAALVRVGATHWVLALIVHHIAADGWSMGLLGRELGQFYQAARRGTSAPVSPLPIQYADFAVWQRSCLTDARLAEHLNYWRARLDGIAPLRLPADRPRPPVRDTVGALRFTEIGSEALGALQRLARANDATLFMTLVACAQVFLARYTGQPDVTIGTATSGRNHPDLDRIVGFFVNTVPLRTTVDESLTFTGFLSAVRDTVLEAFAHDLVPFERLVDEVQASRDPSRTPLVEVMIALENTPPSPVALPGIRTEELPLVSDQVSHDLNLTFIEHDGKLTLAVGYSRALFDEATIDRMTGHLTTLLRGVCAAPGRPLREVPMVAPEGKRQLLAAYRAAPAGAGTAPAACLHERFAGQARQCPDAVAVVCGDTALTYGELEVRSNRLAHYLVGRGVRPDDPVGVCFGRGPELIIALLAVIKAGGAYLPLDPDYPDERLDFMVADADVRIALAGRGLGARLSGQATVVDLDGERQAIAAQPGTPPVVQVVPANLAYVIYTSGSTGRPKGVCVSHENVARLISVTEPSFGFASSDVWAQFHAYAFDVSVWELWGCLLHGGRLVMVESPVARSPQDLLLLLAREQVTVLCQTPSVFYQFIAAEGDSPELSALLWLRYVIFAGEALDFGRVGPWFSRHGHTSPRLVNMYGITETTVHSTFLELTESAVSGATGSAVGRPLADLRCYVLDANLWPVPPGVPGEIYVAGPGLARCYLGRPGLTASRFVADPVSGTGGRMYRSGDLARLRPDGTLEYLGRGDQQVKIRGFRVELGEVESALCAHPAVAAAAAIVRDGRLAAYVTAAGQQPAPAAELRAFLAKRLPGYAVPSFIVTLDRIPLTHNGKLDRRALPDVHASAREAAPPVAPRDETESLLVGIWADTLGLPRAEVGTHDSFFGLGGDSILGIQVVFNARRAGLVFSTRDLYLRSTVAELAGVTRREETAAPGAAETAGPVPLTPIQHWFFENHPVAPGHITQSVLAELTAGLDESALDAALAALIGRHDALRLRYQRGPDGWDQHGTAAGPAPVLRRHDLSEIKDDAGRREAMQRLAARADAGLDLADGPPLAALLFDFGPGRHPWLFITAHHLVVDAVSWRILLQDLSDGYRQAAAGAPVRLAPTTTSFADWARALVRQAADGTLDDELGYWRSLPAATPLPVNGDGPPTVSSIRSVSVSLEPEETDALLHRGPAVLRAGTQQLLLAALAWSVCRWTGQQTVLVDLEGHGREEISDTMDLSGTVGCFTAIYPVTLTAAQDGDWPAAVRGVRDTLRAVPRHGLGYGSLRYLRREPDLVRRRHPEILFNYHSQTGADAVPGNSPLYHAFHDPIGQDRDPAELSSHLLEIVAAVRGQRLEAQWHYCATVHDEQVIRLVAEDFKRALTEMARLLHRAHG